SLVEPSVKGTIAFVILQVDSFKNHKGVVCNQLTIADGPHVIDRAMRVVFAKLVEEFSYGNIVKYIAKNVAVWKEQSNTLSVFDITILTPVYGEKLKSSLEEAFHNQVHEMELEQEIEGIFCVSNCNGILVSKTFGLCKDTKISFNKEGDYCHPCGKIVGVVIVPVIEGTITLKFGGLLQVGLASHIVDAVLQFEEPFLKMYKKNAIMLRVSLLEVEVSGKFHVDGKAIATTFIPT
ncbi:hypothetical protein L7F22_066593, partial [Adiantum nelumboides]|nr:hypothetical protein [Adiantum nelumboides]